MSSAADDPVGEFGLSSVSDEAVKASVAETLLFNMVSLHARRTRLESVRMSLGRETALLAVPPPTLAPWRVRRARARHHHTVDPTPTPKDRVEPISQEDAEASATAVAKRAAESSERACNSFSAPSSALLPRVAAHLRPLYAHDTIVTDDSDHELSSAHGDATDVEDDHAANGIARSALTAASSPAACVSAFHHHWSEQYHAAAARRPAVRQRVEREYAREKEEARREALRREHERAEQHKRRLAEIAAEEEQQLRDEIAAINRAREAQARAQAQAQARALAQAQQSAASAFTSPFTVGPKLVPFSSCPPPPPPPPATPPSASSLILMAASPADLIAAAKRESHGWSDSKDEAMEATTTTYRATIASPDSSASPTSSTSTSARLTAAAVAHQDVDRRGGVAPVGSNIGAIAKAAAAAAAANPPPAPAGSRASLRRSTKGAQAPAFWCESCAAPIASLSTKCRVSDASLRMRALFAR